MIRYQCPLPVQVGRQDMDSPAERGGLIHLLVRTRSRGRVGVPVGVSDPEREIRRPVLLRDVAFALFTDLAGVACLRAFRIPFDFDDGPPSGTVVKGQT